MRDTVAQTIDVGVDKPVQPYPGRLYGVPKHRQGPDHGYENERLDEVVDWL